MADENQNNNDGKRGRGRPKGSKNVVSKNISTIIKDRQASANHLKRMINYFVINKFSEIDKVYNALSDRDKGKMMMELIKYATPTAGQDATIVAKEQEKPKQITSIKVVYQKPNKEDNNTIDITPIDVNTDSIEDADDDDNIIDDNEPLIEY